MKTIKIIYFDSIGIDAQSFESRLKNECKSIYVIKEGVVIVNYIGTAKELFDSLFSSDNRNNVLICDLDSSTDSYWGYMSIELWEWLKNQDSKNN